jgi:hypothetical protein
MPYDERPASLPLDREECRTALWRVRGNISQAAEILKVPSSRLRAFVRSSPNLQREIEEAAERLKDIAEEVVYEALTDEDDPGRKDSMARFVLTNLGQDRGYAKGTGKGPQLNLNMPQGGKISISWEDGTSINDNDTPKTIEGTVVNGG